MGGVRTAALVAQRLTAKMHRELIAWAGTARAGLCGPYFEPVMDKTAYKTQLTYPDTRHRRRNPAAVASPSAAPP
jgi:conjugal transfer pilus assembly protein TraU